MQRVQAHPYLRCNFSHEQRRHDVRAVSCEVSGHSCRVAQRLRRIHSPGQQRGLLPACACHGYKGEALEGVLRLRAVVELGLCGWGQVLGEGVARQQRGLKVTTSGRRSAQRQRYETPPGTAVVNASPT